MYQTLRILLNHSAPVSSMNILIIKTGAMGDVVRSTFLAQALKDKFGTKSPKIFWLTDRKVIPLFINNPYTDQVIAEEDKNEIKSLYFDLVINLEESEELCRFASSLSCNHLIGFYYSGGEILPTPSIKEWFNMSAVGKKPQNDILKKQNQKTHRQILSEIVGINPTKYEPFLRLTSKQRSFAKGFLRRHGFSRYDLIIGINTGAADRWPKALSIEKTAKLIDRIHEKFQAKILLFGGPNEIERNRKVLALAKAPIICTGCGNDLIEFPSLISICNLFVIFRK